MPWRPLPDPLAPPVKLDSSLDRLLRSFGGPPVSGVQQVFDGWADVVGEAMAARTRPAAIEGEALVVACDEPAVASHVRFLEPQLVARLAELMGERSITRVVVRVTSAGRAVRRNH